MKPNSWQERQRNKKALAKKARAKARHFEALNKLSALHLEHDENIMESEGQKGALVLHSGNGICQVLSQGEVKIAKFWKELPLELQREIVVGDHVSLLQEGEEIFVTKRFQRKNHIARLRKDNTRCTGQMSAHVLAANVDVGVIVASVAEPSFQQNFVERCILLCTFGKVRPLLCLTKTDLSEVTPEIVEYYQKKLGLQVIQTSAKLSEGIGELSQVLEGKVAVVFGKSGVGKSTLIQALNPHFVLKTNEVSQKSQEGRHTTTASQMYAWSKDSYIIDTPGIRALNIEHIDPLDLQYYFPEFEEYRACCKYNDCVHIHEAQCGIKDAVSEGHISAERYNSFRKLVDE